VILSSVDKLFHHANVNQAKLVEFAPGDIVKGKVIKLFPNQTAVVQFNGSPLVAQLHAPLMNHTAYWFEVQPKINSQLQLKVLAPLQGLPVQGEKIIPLLKELHLPPTKINEKLILSLTEKGLPLPGKELPMISKWLSSSTNIDLDLQTIGQMIELKLPFTKETFLSVRSLYDGSSFAKQLQTLFSFLENQDVLTGQEIQLKEVVSRLLFPMQYEKGTAIVHTLLEQWLDSSGKSEQKASFSLLQKLSFLPPHLTEEQASAKMAEALLTQQEPGANSNQEITGKNMLYQLFAGTKMIKNGEETGTLSSRFSLEDVFAPFISKDELKERLLKIEEQLFRLTRLTSEEKAVVEKFTFLSEGKWLGEAKELANAFKLLFQSLGLEHERKITQHVKSHPDNALKGEFSSLKALLLQFQQQHISGPERELADHLIHKITGYQLLAREDGPITSLYMQLPLLLGNELHDVVIQWEGRRKGDGEIDPSYCRILFCLQLAYLKETIVDVTVQNRVVNIGIMNDHPFLSALTKQLGPKLKENLSALHYHLSDVKVVTSVKEQQSRGFLAKQGNVYQQSSPYSGVDVKV
jgi:hypothetical protein